MLDLLLLNVALETHPMPQRCDPRVSAEGSDPAHTVPPPSRPIVALHAHAAQNLGVMEEGLTPSLAAAHHMYKVVSWIVFTSVGHLSHETGIY